MKIKTKTNEKKRNENKVSKKIVDQIKYKRNKIK